MDAWPDALKARIDGLVELPLDRHDLIWIGQGVPGFLARIGTDAVNGPSEELVTMLDEHFDAHPYRQHARLGFASFRLGKGPVMPVSDAKGMLAIMTGFHSRLASLIAKFLSAGQDMNLYLRPWREIPPWAEFRVFLRDGQVAGVTQLDPHPTWPEISARLEEICSAITICLTELFPRLHMTRAVIDLMLTDENGMMTAHLSEINPFIKRTHPGLFDWNRPSDFDGRFRFNKIG